MSKISFENPSDDAVWKYAIVATLAAETIPRYCQNVLRFFAAAENIQSTRERSKIPGVGPTSLLPCNSLILVLVKMIKLYLEYMVGLFDKYTSWAGFKIMITNRKYASFILNKCVVKLLRHSLNGSDWLIIIVNQSEIMSKVSYVIHKLNIDITHFTGYNQRR